MRMSATRGVGSGSYSRDSDNPLNWRGEEYCLQKDTKFDMLGCQWNEVTLNEQDLSFMLDDETTPIKSCGDLAYHATHSGNMNKEPIECKETSFFVKRRRMLQFDTQVADSSLCDNEMPSTFLKSNVREEEDSIEEGLPEASQWISGFSADPSTSNDEDLDQSFEGWFAQCLNDSEMNCGSDNVSFSGASDIQIDISEFCNSPPVYEANVVQQHVTKTPQPVVFKGRKSFVQTPTGLASSVAYPFAFIKPCGVHGDVTLKDINQRIHTPSKPKQNTEDPSYYPTSSFSGKPVVGKTRIRTEGGKGSITIMRTKG